LKNLVIGQFGNWVIENQGRSLPVPSYIDFMITTRRAPVEERPFRAAFGVQIETGFSPGAGTLILELL
jgi:hypothetical protein